MTRRRRLVAAAAMLGAMAAGGAAASATASRRRPAWCAAHQLNLSAARGLHTVQTQAGGSVIWFLELTHEGTPACLTGGRLTLIDAHTNDGASIKLMAAAGFFGEPNRPWVLRARQRAFVELDDPGILTPAEGHGCKSQVLLTFGLPHDGGSLSVRTPNSVGTLCPGRAFSLSEIVSSAAFQSFIQMFQTTHKLPY